MKECIFEIIENKPLTKDVFLLRMTGDTSEIIRPGQFVNIKIDGTFLRRPLSVCDKCGNTLTVAYRVVGKGTELLSRMKKGDSLNVLTGLGNGFDISCAGERPLLIGGGMGFTPLYYLAKSLRNPTVILGFNSKDEVVFEDEFRSIGALIITTADGSYGMRGLVTDAMKELSYSYFYTCGPEAMFKAINAVAGTEGEFSFEARMGCGFGACMGCTCETLAGRKRICKDGPILKRSELHF